MSQKEHELFAIGDNANPVIGTEILDRAMPSDINFEKPSGIPFAINQNLSQKEIVNYTVRGSSKSHLEPKYPIGAIVPAYELTELIELRFYDQVSSPGIKGIYQTIRGFCKKKVQLEGGYMYVLEDASNALQLRECYYLANLLKVFHDVEEDKLRLVFRSNEHLTNKNIKALNNKQFIGLIAQRLKAIGMSLEG